MRDREEVCVIIYARQGRTIAGVFAENSSCWLREKGYASFRASYNHFIRTCVVSDYGKIMYQQYSSLEKMLFEV